jgi:hypothetical protein
MVAGFALLAALPAQSGEGGGERRRGGDLEAALSGRPYPLTLKLRELTPEWRRFTLGEDGGMAGYMQAMMSLYSGSGGTRYYTRGQIATIGGESYMVVYRTQSKPVNFMQLMQQGPNAAPPAPEKLTPETTLSLSLLNVRTTNSLNEIRPFNMEQEMAEEPVTGRTAGNITSESNLKQIGTALLMYVGDWDEVLPVMTDAAAAKKALFPYVKNEAVFVHPETKEPYRPNPVLSKKKIAHIQNPAAMIAFYESKPGVDGTRTVVFLDGHTERVPESDWPRLQRASKIPAVQAP